MTDLKKSGLAYISPSVIEPNPENPRKKMGFDEKRMKELLESIKDLGILVPLIAYLDEKKKKYILLDGERRWRCAKQLELSRVPVNLIDKPSRLQNLLEMFNIHNVRIEWGAMETAWKLEKIMNESGKTKDYELAKLTSLKTTQIKKLKILLNYNKKYQNLVFLGPQEGGLKEDFLVEINPVIKFIKEKTNLNTNSLLDSLIKKHKKKIIINYPIEFRLLKKIIFSEKVDDTEKVEIINRLIGEKKYSIKEANEESIRFSLSYEEFIKKCSRMKNSLRSLKIRDLKQNEKEELKKRLKDLQREIENKLKEIK